VGAHQIQCDDIKNLTRDLAEIKAVLREKNVMNGFTRERIEDLEKTDDEIYERLDGLHDDLVSLREEVYGLNVTLRLFYRINVAVIISVFTTLAVYGFKVILL